MVYYFNFEKNILEKYEEDKKFIDFVIQTNNLSEEDMVRNMRIADGDNIFILFRKRNNTDHYIIYIGNKNNVDKLYNKVVSEIADKWKIISNRYSGIDSVYIKKDEIDKIFKKLGLIEVLIWQFLKFLL